MIDRVFLGSILRESTKLENNFPKYNLPLDLKDDDTDVIWRVVETVPLAFITTGINLGSLPLLGLKPHDRFMIAYGWAGEPKRLPRTIQGSFIQAMIRYNDGEIFDLSFDTKDYRTYAEQLQIAIASLHRALLAIGPLERQTYPHLLV